MSMESAKAFIERMQTDEKFAERIHTCKNSEERLACSKGEGFDFTPEEIAAVKNELSMEELDAVAGGQYHTLRCNLLQYES